MSAVLSIIAALVPFLVDWIQGRQEAKPYAEKQKIRRAAATGDTDTLSRKLDKLRDKAARIRSGG